MAQIPSTTLTATGATGSIFMTTGLVEISGTFVGTVNVQVDVLGDGTWVNATDTTGAAVAITAPGVLRINNGIGCNTRLNCSAYTSGSIVCGLKGL
jgi:hypothetical protein